MKNMFDVAVIGGGIIGSATAHALLSLEPGLRVAVIERDPSFFRSSTALSLANFRIQFGLRENILISMYGIDVIRDFDRQMSVSGEVPGISFRQEGNLFLWQPEQETGGRRALELQNELGGNTRWLDPREVKALVPSYTGGSFSGGTYTSLDGYVDPHGMLTGYRKKFRAMGGHPVTGEVTGIGFRRDGTWMLTLKEGGPVAAVQVVNCAGAWAPEICLMAGIKIPVEPVVRQVFVAEIREHHGRPYPLTVMPSGLYFRSESPGTLLVGKSMPEDPAGYDFKTDENRFYQHLWPELVTLVPSLDRLKLIRSWAGLYAVNRLDGNAILGEWPGCPGFFMSVGFSGHGLQQAPAVGRYMGELILKRDISLDLSIFSPQRILSQSPLTETNLV